MSYQKEKKMRKNAVKNKKIDKVNIGIRNILIAKENAPVLLEHIRRLGKIVNCASTKLLPLMKDESIFYTYNDREYTRFLRIANIGEDSRASKTQEFFRKEASITECMQENNYTLSRIERMAYGMAARFYTGMSRRNSHSKNTTYESSNAPTTNNFKSIHYLDGMASYAINGNELHFEKSRNNGLVKCTNAKIKITTHVGRLTFEFCVREKQIELFKEFIKRKRKGNTAPVEGNLIANLKFKNDGSVNARKTTFHFVVNHQINFIKAYEPECFLGIDFNQRKDVFVVFSDDNIPNINVRHQLDLNNIIKQRADIEREIAASLVKHEIEPRERTGYRKFAKRKNEKQFRHAKKSEDRRVLRLQWKKLGKQIEKELIKANYVNEILNHVQEYRAVLCIDNLGLGKSVGFGHSQLKELLIKECNRKRIPYVLVDTRFTSQICHHCLVETKKTHRLGRHKQFDKVSCNRCKQNYDADRNAAKIIAFRGEEIYDDKKITMPNGWKEKQPEYKNFNELDNDINF